MLGLGPYDKNVQKNHIEDGRFVIEFEKADEKSTAIEYLFLGDKQLPKKGKVTIPMRMRMLKDNVPTNDNIFACKWDYATASMIKSEKQLDLYYTRESDNHNYKDYWYFDFFVEDVKYEFCILVLDRSGVARVIDHEIGQDSDGYYIDVLFEMRMSKSICYE